MTISELESLNSEKFLMCNHEMNWWNILDESNGYELNLDNQHLIANIKKYAVGYCKSERVNYRPQLHSYAIMFEKDGIEFWFHVPNWTFEEEFIKCPKCGHSPFKDDKGWICEKCFYECP